MYQLEVDERYHYGSYGAMFVDMLKHGNGTLCLGLRRYHEVSKTSNSVYNGGPPSTARQPSRRIRVPVGKADADAHEVTHPGVCFGGTLAALGMRGEGCTHLF